VAPPCEWNVQIGEVRSPSFHPPWLHELNGWWSWVWFIWCCWCWVWFICVWCRMPLDCRYVLVLHMKESPYSTAATEPVSFHGTYHRCSYWRTFYIHITKCAKCIAPNADISLQSGRFWTMSIASFRDRLLYFRSCWIVFIWVVWGCNGGLLQFSKGGYHGGSPTAVQAWQPCPL